MSCRSTRASSSAVSLAHLSSGLDDAQIASLFHGLKREGVQAPAPGEQEYRAGLERLALRVADLDVSDSQRDRLLARLSAAGEDEPLDGAAWYAVNNIQAAAEVSRASLEARYAQVAGLYGIEAESIGKLVEGWRSQPGTFEDVEAPDQYRFDRDPGVPQDDRTLRALRKLGYETFLSEPYPVFVYGTLRSGQGNHRLMKDAVQASYQARAEGVGIYGAHAGFPYAVEHDAADAVTVGEVTWLSDGPAGAEARQSLDWLEGFHSDSPSTSHYERVLRPVTVEDSNGEVHTVQAWMYMARGSARRQLREADRILDGDWVAARAAYREPRPRYWD